MSNPRLRSAFSNIQNNKQDKENLIPGMLGFIIGGVQTVEITSRPGYVYVRLRSNQSEVIQAYNDKVSPVYDLPVLIKRDEIDTTRYKIESRDVGRYENWGSPTAFLPRHGNQHSFSPENGGGGDIVWVYDRQFTPLEVIPSGSYGARSALIMPDIIYSGANWRAAGGTGTPDLVAARPTDNQALLLLLYMNTSMNPGIVTGTLFDASITGMYSLTPYIPTPPANSYPLAFIRLVSGTSVILWDNIYDVRQFVNAV